MFLATLVLGSATALASAGSSPLNPSADYLLPGEVRRFTLIYTARVPHIPTGAQALKLWLPVPRDSAVQRIEQLAFSQPVQLATEPKYGNRIAFCEVPHPAGSTELQMTFACTRQELRTDLQRLEPEQRETDSETAAFLKPERLVTITDQIQAISSTLTTGKTNTLQKAHAIYDYVVRTMRYDKTQPGWGTGSSAFACTARAGNCTDFHAFFTALCRAQGVASGFEIGLYLPYERGAQEPLGAYHCWAYFRVPGQTWVPVDCSEANRWPARTGYFFGNLTCNRVAFSTGRDITLVPKQAGPPLNYFIEPYAEVDGQPVPAEKAWSYRELD